MSDESLNNKYLFDQIVEQNKQFAVVVDKFSMAIENNTVATNKLSDKITNLEQSLNKKVSDCKTCSITVFGRILAFLVFIVGMLALGRELIANKDVLSAFGKIFF